jgi:hypothetical protein
VPHLAQSAPGPLQQVEVVLLVGDRRLTVAPALPVDDLQPLAQAVAAVARKLR